MKHSFFKTLLMGAALLMGGGGVNTAWAENTVQTLGSAGQSSWTATNAGDILTGSTITIDGVVLTFGGTNNTWSWNASNSGYITDMPNTGSSSSGVTTIAVGDAIPSHGGTYKLVVSKAGVVTITGKGGGTGSNGTGRYVLVAVGDDNKVTRIIKAEAGNTTDNNKNIYAVEEGTYYFMQLAINASYVTSGRYTLKGLSFAEYAAVEGLTVWNFDEAEWKSHATVATVSSTGSTSELYNNLWLTGSITYDDAQTRFKIASGNDNQIRFKVKKDQKGYVVIVAKGTNGVKYGLGSNADVSKTSAVCSGGIYKVYTSTFVQADNDKNVLIHGNNSEGQIEKIAWVPNTNTSTALASVTLGNAGFSTFCPTATVNIPEDVQAYILNSVTGTTATWNEITTQIPAFAGVLLVGEGGKQYDFYCPSASNKAIDGVVATGPTDAWYNKNNQDDQKKQQNILVGTYATTSIPASNATTSYYGLKKNTNTFGKVTADVSIPAGMAYFSVSGGGGVHEFVLDFDGTETGIALPGQTTIQQNSQPLYSLSGVRVVGKPAPGIYVQGGKKIVIK